MKKIKNILLALILVPCMFLLTACGDDVEKQFKETASINTEGTYTETTKTELNNYLGVANNQVVENEKTTLKGYRITGSIVSEEASIEYNGIVSFGETFADTKMAIKMNMAIEGQQIQSEAYVKDSVMYMHSEMQGMEMKYKMPFLTGEEMDEAIDDEIGLASIEDILEEIIANDDVTVKVFIDGATTKYEIKENMVAGALESGLVTYLVFENDVLQGIQYTLEVESEVINITIQNYEGKISYPSFDDYALLPTA